MHKSTHLIDLSINGCWQVSCSLAAWLQTLCPYLPLQCSLLFIDRLGNENISFWKLPLHILVTKWASLSVEVQDLSSAQLPLKCAAHDHSWQWAVVTCADGRNGSHNAIRLASLPRCSSPGHSMLSASQWPITLHEHLFLSSLLVCCA